tara:strand:- start:9 stop:383 length:375 start_codon:yes stop_codon:yes gene_type:complete
VAEKKESGITQSDVARAIGVHRSVINRELRGTQDLSIGRLGELAWAYGRTVKISFPKEEIYNGNNAALAKAGALHEISPGLRGEMEKGTGQVCGGIVSHDSMSSKVMVEPSRQRNHLVTIKESI